MAKRAFDILLSVVGLIIMLPVTILIALIIFIDDRGPVFFRQERIGLNFKPFTLYKFRTMRINTGSSCNRFDVGDQSRVTRVGRVLRKSKLDELPQLINVLKDDMSLVGPRPEVKKWIDVYPLQWTAVLTVKPGITDDAAILFRHEEEILARSANPELQYKEIILPRKIDIYLKYIKNRSFTGDIKIIFNTIISILK